MIIYENTKKGFIEDSMMKDLSNILEINIKNKIGRKTTRGELNSWKNSLIHMSFIIDQTNIPDDANVLIEYNIPQTSKRVDFVLAGKNKDNYPSIILVELKQWETAEMVEHKNDIVSTFLNNNPKYELVHPSYQVNTYENLIRDYSKIVTDENVEIKSCAYLHNFSIESKDNIVNQHFKGITDISPIFVNTERKELAKYLSNTIVFGDDDNIMKRIDKEPNKPNKSLQNLLGSLLSGNKVFDMIDTQKVIYESVLSLTSNLNKNDEKKVVIIEGGPGTGKTVVAFQLLAKFLQKEFNSVYVTKNSAVRDVYLEKISEYKNTNDNSIPMTKARVKSLMTGSGSFYESEENFYDIIVVDEAHRLTRKSGIFKNMGENQPREIINSTNMSIFFVDETQRVTVDDIGTIDEIKKQAKNLGIKESSIYEYKMESQFRTGGSDGYISWINNLLEIEYNANFNFDRDFNYDFRVFDNPAELHNFITRKNKSSNNNSRMVAGYCWDWISKKDKNKDDIIIGNYSAKWNLLKDGMTWASNEGTINEIGCIYTCQGLEFDYCGVIIGDDLLYDEKNGIYTDFENRSKDEKRKSLRGLMKLIKNDPKKGAEIADSIIKNTYKVLLTRGLKGTAIYCTNKELNEYFKMRLKQKNN